VFLHHLLAVQPCGHSVNDLVFADQKSALMTSARAPIALLQEKNTMPEIVLRVVESLSGRTGEFPDLILGHERKNKPD
jgi:hypothetical protein